MRSQFERSKRALSGQAPPFHRAWIGAAAVLIAGLIGALAWIAQSNLTRPHVLPLAENKAAPPPPVIRAAPEPLPPLVMLQPEAKKPAPPKPVAVALARPAKPVHALARPAKVRIARAVVAKAPVPKRAATPPPIKPEAGESDSDVALISAIVGYGKRHPAPSGQKEATCPGGKKCKAVEP